MAGYNLLKSKWSAEVESAKSNQQTVKWQLQTWLLSGRGRSWITGLAGISGLGPNSEPRGNNRPFPETRERDRVPVKKIGSRDSIFGLVNSTYSFEITNHNQHASNIKYLANLIKKYWTYFRYQKLADFLVCFPPSVRVQVRWPPSWKICLRIQLSFGFWGRAVEALDNFFPKVGMTIENNILEVLVGGFVSPILQIGDIDKITT